MSVKGLLRKEWKQSRAILFLITLLFLFHFPIRAMVSIENWREEVRSAPAEAMNYLEWSVHSALGMSVFSLVIIVLLVTLAVQLIGSERSTRRQDFAFALPYRRRTMFLVKWLMGVVPVLILYPITFLSAYFMIVSSEFGFHLDGVNFLEAFMLPLLGFIATYSFTLFIGTITGEMISQIALTFIFTIFPVGILVLVGYFFEVNFNNGYFFGRISEEASRFIWPIYTVYNPTSAMGDGEFMNLWIPLAATLLFVGAGQWLYEQNHSEFNGEFLIFKQLEPIFRAGIIVCFALLGGMIGSGLVPWSLKNGSILELVFYWVGAAIFTYLSILLTNRLFSMNITIKGK
ncbi:ABC transporter permease subunit [Alkalihalophilus marmarensis]|uniref:ABC transporter permease subunit n=1 Tax=Alkalihalophilus marmarensis TaxID=521377 RepID=UPI002DB7BEF2|nr:ABC transporter permease subunit [Alkalihalophilus marmarensis]MEC2070560.1 hypothetical protein [Alkalihalophilus marmarensis]